MEIIAVISILLVGLLGMMSLLVQNIQVQSVNSKRLIAQQLAQEGIEIVRQIRDNNFIKDRVYDESLGDGTYFVDYKEAVLRRVDGDEQKIVRINSDGFYGSEGEDTPFSRWVMIRTREHYLEVYSTVDWADRGKNYEYQLETRLYEWF